MKIAMLANDLRVSGGYQKLILRLSEELKTLRHEVIVYTPILNENTCYPELIKKIDINTTEKTLKKNSNNSVFLKIKRVFQFIILAKRIKNPDVILAHNEMCLVSLNFINTKKIKVLWMLNNQFPEYLYKNKPLNNGHGYSNSSENNQSVIKRWIKKIFFILIKKGLKKVDLLLTYDNFNYQLVKENVNNEARVVYAGADIESKNIDVKRRMTYPIRLLAIGVIFDYRRYEDIIEAIRLLKNEQINCTLKIIGSTEFSPEYLEFLKTLITKYGLQNEIEFCGAISDQEVDKLYRESDIFIFVNDALTWGISIFEAMSYQLPTIITNNIGAIDLIKNEDCSFIVKPKSPELIAAAVKEIMLNENKVSKMLDNYHKVIEMVSWKSFTNRIMESIESINKNKNILNKKV